MDTENQTPPSAEVKPPVAAAATIISPWAVHFPTGLKDEVLAEIVAFAPKNACPKHLDIAKTTVKAMIAALPEAARGCEVRLECLGTEGKQILAQVTPRLVTK
jgi:hypothetical protein